MSENNTSMSGADISSKPIVSERVERNACEISTCSGDVYHHAEHCVLSELKPRNRSRNSMIVCACFLIPVVSFDCVYREISEHGSAQTHEVMISNVEDSNTLHLDGDLASDSLSAFADLLHGPNFKLPELTSCSISADALLYHRGIPSMRFPVNSASAYCSGGDIVDYLS